MDRRDFGSGRFVRLAKFREYIAVAGPAANHLARISAAPVPRYYWYRLIIFPRADKQLRDRNIIVITGNNDTRPTRPGPTRTRRKRFRRTDFL